MAAIEKTKACLGRIAEMDAVLNAFIRVDEADAIAAAAASDQRQASGSLLSPLDGRSVAIKDNLAMRGKPWTAGIGGRRELIAREDAAAVARLRDAGAVLIGSTNMDEGALGALTDNPEFGRCTNPLDHNLTPGGSSGGSAVAVAAGLSELALGTDTMGSVRVPAAYCGVAGIKPTSRSIEREGLALLCPSLDTIGPMARDVGSLWPALEILGSASAQKRWAASTAPEDLQGLRVGVPRQLEMVACEPSVRAGLQRAEAAFQAQGSSVQQIDLKGWHPHRSRRAGLLVIEAEGAVEFADLIDRPGAISDHLRSMLNYGRALTPEKLGAARAVIAEAAEALDRAFDECDALLMPTVPQRAFAHGSHVPENQADLTALANFSGCPSVALPVSLPGEILPGSVQLIGRRWSDATLLGWAGLLDDALKSNPSTM